MGNRLTNTTVAQGEVVGFHTCYKPPQWTLFLSTKHCRA
jgi:hypothetical protein